MYMPLAMQNCNLTKNENSFFLTMGITKIYVVTKKSGFPLRSA